MKKISVELSKQGINQLAKEISEYQRMINTKADELAKRLAEIGVTKAQSNFDMAEYVGLKDHMLTVEQVGDKQYKVLADGETVLFMEFGTGITYANPPHPEQGEFGAGTYEPNYGHWDDPEGWFLPRSKGGRQHTFGNPPNMSMYNTVRYLEQEFERIVQEVFTNE